VALQRRPVRDCLAEELRRLDADEIYELALKSLGKIDRRARTATAAKPAAGKPAKEPAKTTAKPKTGSKAKAGATP
jgi:hypothetical protein